MNNNEIKIIVECTQILYGCYVEKFEKMVRSLYFVSQLFFLFCVVLLIISNHISSFLMFNFAILFLVVGLIVFVFFCILHNFSRVFSFIENQFFRIQEVLK